MKTSTILLTRLGLGLALATTTWLALTPAGPDMPGQSDKLAHAMAFLGLALLADFAFPRQDLLYAKVIPLAGYGLLIELVQGLLSYRQASLGDWLADCAGILVYLLLIPLLRRVPVLRRRWQPGPASAPGAVGE